MRKIGWYGIPRQAIPGVMLGMEPVGRQLHERALGALSAGADVAIAFFVDDPEDDRLPCLAVIPDAKVAELLSWLHTFSAETFPLSQYCSVLTQSDWELLEGAETDRLPFMDRYAWSSLVAGEMLGQAEALVPAASVPLSWANGCYSYSSAKTLMAYGVDLPRLLPRIAERLAICESDSVFQRKRIAPATLASIWSYAKRKQQSYESNPAEAVYAVVSSVSPQMGLSLRANSSLSSSSAERRVQGFDGAADQAMALRSGTGGQRQGMGAMLAGAAFLVGSGTSHIDLLAPYSRECPEAYAWFGLFAGLSGPRTWDAAWLRLTKGVDRLLAAQHEPTDVPQADLSWAEYDWLSKLSGSFDEYSKLPKQNGRSLTIELLPTITCQFRFVGGATSKGSEQPNGQPFLNQSQRGPKDPSATLVQLEKARELLTEAHSLLIKAEGAAEISRKGSGQSALFENDGQRADIGRKRATGKRLPKSGQRQEP